MKDLTPEVDFFQRSPQLGPWDSFRIFVWNPETHQFLRRTWSSWAKITVFYIIFYIVLAVFIGINYTLFSLTLNVHSPKWQLEDSLIGTSPGLGYRPMMSSTNQENTLIWYKESNNMTYQPWIDSLLTSLDGYYSPRKFSKGNGKIVSCSHSRYPEHDEVCEVDVQDWDQCSRDNSFGYDSGSPCIFLKLNKIYGWKPDYYLENRELPSEMPNQLKNYIKSINNTLDRRNVWVSCDGESPHDKQYIGPISYHPGAIQGFPGYYFPYLNQKDYLSPLVAVRFENPTRGILINVECRAWAKNIEYNRQFKLGSVHFEILVDQKMTKTSIQGSIDL